jgi:hypothetical protein
MVVVVRQCPLHGGQVAVQETLMIEARQHQVPVVRLRAIVDEEVVLVVA